MGKCSGRISSGGYSNSPQGGVLIDNEILMGQYEGAPHQFVAGGVQKLVQEERLG